MYTTDQTAAAHAAEIEARKAATIARLAPVVADYRERRVRPEFTYERRPDGSYSVFVLIPGSSQWQPVFLCEISRGWLRLGGSGWSFTHPISGTRSHKNRYDAAYDCFRRLAR